MSYPIPIDTYISALEKVGRKSTADTFKYLPGQMAGALALGLPVRRLLRRAPVKERSLAEDALGAAVLFPAFKVATGLGEKGQRWLETKIKTGFSKRANLTAPLPTGPSLPQPTPKISIKALPLTKSTGVPAAPVFSQNYSKPNTPQPIGGV